MPLKKREELLHDQGCGAYLAVISKGFEKSKDLKVEFERVRLTTSSVLVRVRHLYNLPPSTVAPTQPTCA